MRKAFIALGVVIIALLAAFATFNQQPKYAGVSMPKTDYRHLEDSRQDINELITALRDFDYTKPKTMVTIEKASDTIVKNNSSNLSGPDAQSLREALYGRQGIVTIVQAAKKGHYNIDGSVASRFHNGFNTIITMSVNAINKSSAQRADIVTQMKTDLNIESAIYKIGAKNEE
ncbi:molecular chaperone [Leuconostoc carnosum]|uniref:molecular chaperone n=1 Tax=Leuconostoc carnosum TaxID=1252 RepID=UPI00123B2E5D|nr:molecular chaperone [Leuconostoc carnosum]KAA8362470.1 molecular chaperone [Leuconostoc carnosum]KAA8367019.1 molecular chaperone [Leuconostoc carnosum]KAA8374011.1 molecular chaperone [Leuconostoc carnosum]